MVRWRGLTASDHTQGHNTVGRTPLDEGSACHRDLYLTTHNTHNRQTMPLAGLEPANPAGDQPQTLALRPLGLWDRLTIRINKYIYLFTLLIYTVKVRSVT